MMPAFTEKKSCWRMHNMFYKDPVNITPRKFVKVNISAKDDAALARRRYIENNKVDTAIYPYR
jgi:hypothetical protein